MRKIFFSMVVLASFFATQDCFALNREGFAFGSRVVMEFYDGILETQAAKVVIHTDGRGRTNFAIYAEVDDPDGGYKKTELGWARPGERNRYEVPLMYFLMDGNVNPGTGYIKISTSAGQLCYLPFSFDGKYINWGREFRQRSESPSLSPPGPSTGSTIVKKDYGHLRLNLQIRTVPSDCQVLYGREQDGFKLLHWSNQQFPATIYTYSNDEQFKFVISKPGYQDFEWVGPLGLLGCDEDGTLARVEFNLKERTWSNW